MRFKNREEAAYLLLEKLKSYQGLNPLVLAIPRGAIRMAQIIQQGLQGELGVILVRKIGAPGNPEFAIGSIGLSGIPRSEYSFETLGIPRSYLETEGQKQLAILKERFKRYGLDENYYHNLYTNRIVIIVDDGIATGATVLAAIEEVRSQKPAKILVASAVASEEAAEKIKTQVDDLVVLYVSRDFYAVSQFYEEFPQIDDETVIQIL